MRKGTHRLLAFLLCGTMIFSGLSSAAVYAEDKQAQNEIAEVQGEDTNAAQGEAEDITAKGETSEDAANASEGQTSSVQEDNGEPAADEAEPAGASLTTINGENEIMPMAVDLSSVSLAASYYEKSAAYAPADATNVIILRMNALSESQIKNLFNDQATTYELKGPGSSSASLNIEKKGVVSNLYVIWLSLKERLTETGNYTVTVKNGSTSVTATFELIQVNFHAEPGQFPGGEKTYTGYASKGVYLSGYNFPVPISDTGEYLGWAKEENKTTYNDVVTSPSALGEGSPYDAYAVYGVARKYNFEFQSANGKALTDDTLDLGEIEYSVSGSYTGATVKIKNTGNQPLKELSLMTTPAYFALSFDSSEVVNVDNTTTVTVTPKKGLGAGTYEETIRFWFRNQLWKDLKVKVVIGKPTVKVTMEPVEKEYGKVLTSADIYESLTIEPDEFKAEQLGLTFNSQGFAADRGVGDYLVELASSSSGYNVDFTGANVQVTKAEPKAVTVNAGGAYVGQTLRDVNLSGTFANPNMPGWSVTGQLEWKEPDKRLNSVSESGISCEWTFTPQGEDEKNYTSTTGTVNVIVSELEPTNISITGPNTFIYNGGRQSPGFQADRPGEISVRYSTEAEPDEWTDQAPVDAGTYHVKATMDATSTHARGELETEMVINPCVADVTFVLGDKVYDGTTTVKPEQIRSVLSNIRSVDNGKVKLGDISAVYDSANAGRRNVVITPGALAGERGHNYILGNKRYNAISTIHPAEVTFKVKNGNTITKAYGQNISPLQSEQFEATGLALTDTIGDLHPEFISLGAPANAAPSSYEIRASLPAGSNYTLASENAGTVTVTKAVPIMRSASAGSGKTGNPLGTVSLTGEFINPYTGEIVQGAFAWKDKEAQLPSAGTVFEGEWIFTIDEQFRDRYAFNDGDTYEGTANVSVLDKSPIGVTVSPKTAVYTGEPQEIDTPVLEEGIEKDKVSVVVEYKERKDIVTAALEPRDTSHDDYVTVPPTEVGEYDVHVHVYAEGYSQEYADNLVETMLTITPATPTFTEQTLQVSQGTLLGDVKGVDKPVGVKNESLEGTLVWDDPNTSVEADGGVYYWTFIPESINYGSVRGRTRINLLPDTRKLDVKVYNLPNAEGYYDYAVVNLPESGSDMLRAGEQITFFDSEGNPVCAPVEITQEALNLGHVEIRLNAGALGDSASSLTAKITSSIKHEGTTVQCPAELDVLVEENITTYPDDETELLAKLADGYDALIKEITFTINEGENITVTASESDRLAAKIKSLALGHAHIELTVVLAHPDPLHKNENITINKTIHVTVKIRPGDVTVEVPVKEGAPATTVPSKDQESLQEQVLTGEDKAQVEQGIDVFVDLVVEDADATVSETEKAAIEKCIDAHCPGYVVGQYLDISLFKTVGEGEAQKIDSIKQLITLVISVPEDLRAAGRTFRIIRMHDGTAVVLDDLDNDPNTITIQTNLFSTYAIAYSDTAAGAGNPGGSSGTGDKASDKASPQTGDNNHIVMWSMLMIVSLLCAVVTVMFSVRRRSRVRAIRRRRRR